MSGFVERAVPRRNPEAYVVPADEQVPHWLVDRRLERRELAKKRAKNRTGDRRG